MTDRIEIAGLKIARELHDFMRQEALPGTGIGNSAFWSAFSAIVCSLNVGSRQGAASAKVATTALRIQAGREKHVMKPRYPWRIMEAWRLRCLQGNGWS